ncbi:MAG TPA: ATP-binding cassette domain-containing protein [Longimicrobiales bacterium]
MSGGVAVAVPELRLEGVAVRHRRRRLVSALTWTHRAGRIAWIVGENGAGKSSLLRVLAGRARPAAGAVALLDPSGRPAERLYYHPAMRLPAGITVGEWRRFVGRLGGTDDRDAAPDRDVAALLRPDVPSHRLLRRLSTGESKRLLLEALLGRPAPFVFLDEPYEHLSARARDGLTATLVARARESVVVVATNQPVPAYARGPVVHVDGERAIIDPGTEGAS